MLKSYKFRLYPNKKQIVSLEQQLNAHRWVYNYALAERKETYEQTKKSLSYKDQALKLPELRTNHPELTIANYSSLQQTLRRLDKTFKAFFRRCKTDDKPGYPRFKNYFRFNTIQYAKIGDGCKIKNNRLYIQNVGEIKVKWHREIEGKIKTLSITRRIDKWYVNFQVEYSPLHRANNGSVIGIDLGITNFITTSEGEQVDSPKFLKEAEKNLIKAQKKLSRRKKGSKRRRKARILLAKRHEKIKNQRTDFCHKLSHYLTNKHSGFIVEKLNITDMVKNQYLAKSIADASWNQFLAILKVKAENAGQVFQEVDPKYTSQLCSNCDNLVKKSLSVRVHKCPFCGLVIDRDINAALNILKRARTVHSVLATVG